MLDCSVIPNIEYTALQLLSEFEENLAQRRIVLWLAALTPGAYQVVDGSALGKRLTHKRLFLSMQLAVNAYLDRARAHMEPSGKENGALETEISTIPDIQGSGR